MNEFLNYYQDELLFLRKKGGEFAKKHPEIASYIDIKDGESSDPHTERIIESVAFMTAKLNKKIDDNAQSIAFYLISALYPNLINTFPPCSIAVFDNKENISTTDIGYMAKGTPLVANSKFGNSCIFKTLYSLNIFPIRIEDVSLSKDSRKIGDITKWNLNINLKTTSVPFEKIEVNELLFYINSEIIEDALLIYASLFSMINRKAFLKINDSIFEIDKQNIIPCGFDDDNSVCPVSKYSNNSFQLFQEMLHFKQKFMFFKILNLDEIIKNSGIEHIDTISIKLDIDFTNERLIQIIKKGTIIINATPIVNLFPVTSDPFRFTGTTNKYLLVPDQMRDNYIEIQSILNVHMIDSETMEDRITQPYFSLAVDSHTNLSHEVFWTHSKESSDIRGMNGSDTYLSFVDINMNPFIPYSNVVYANVLCTNRFETREIPIFSNLDIDSSSCGDYTAKIILKTTNPISFSETNSTLWSLVSQLSATHISIANENNLLNSISKLTEIFSCKNKLKYEELISNIVKITSNKIVKRFGKDAWRGFVRGTEFKVFIKDEHTSFFNYFFCCILNQYLSSCVSINSFIELCLISETTNKELARWAPTSGRRELL